MVKKSSLTASLICCVFALCAMAAVLFGLATTAYALDDQITPTVYCRYYTIDADGNRCNEVDGNKLVAGTYDVDFNISGLSSLSVIEVTSTYNTEQITDVKVMDDMSNSYAVESMGNVTSNGNLVVGFVSTNADSTLVSEEETYIATVRMSFAPSIDEEGNELLIDAEQFLEVAVNPNLTFAQISYADGYEDEYAIDIDDETYTGNLSDMIANVTPEFVKAGGYSVTGELVVATSNKGATKNVPVNGVFNIDLYTTPDMNEADKVNSAEFIQDENSNSFVIKSLDSGTYYATISSDFFIPRNVTIVINDSDVSAGSIPVIACDFNKDKGITSADVLAIYRNSGKDDLRYDLNGDGGISTADAVVVYLCSGSANYYDLTIE